MDSVIPLGQKNTLAEYMILSGVDNHPPMLDKDLVSKDLWERVQLLMQGTSLTKQERECKLYDAFDKFTHIKGESLHNLPPEWSKFVTGVKLVKDLHTTNFDHLHAYLEQHELHANKVCLLRERFAVPVFSPGDDPIAYFNKTMAFQTVVASSSNATSSGGNNAGRQARVVKCYNYQGEGHMARKCTQPKRPRNAAWYKDKAIFSGPNGQAVQTIILNNVAFQTEDLDTYDSDCDDISNAKAVLMANISNYGSDVISEAQQDSMFLSVIEQMSEQMINHVNNWEKANKEQNNESITAELERYKERVKTFEQRLNIDLSSREKMIDSQMDDMIKEKLALKEQVDSLEQNLSKQIKEKESLLQTFTVFKNESKEKENKYMENEIDLEKRIKELDNIVFKVGYQNPFYLKKAQRIKPTLYDGIVIFAKHVAMPVIDDEETLILEEESRSRMSEKEKDPEAYKQNISHKPIDYEKLNRLTEDFGKRFTPQQELSAKQAF
ncbi:reverse transcriptase domain-containing protein [Tanacetum coccineum]